MRRAFINRLLDIAKVDDRVMLVVGDLGYGVVDNFALQLPRQFINAGVAEQSMIGMAAGLAKTGCRVIAYSIGNFPTLRALEQIRNDVCFHNLDVAIVSVGAGLAYGTLGYTHHAVEDVSVMRAMPGMRVVSPADDVEATLALEAFIEAGGPTYIRLGKGDEPRIHTLGAPMSLDAPLRVRDGAALSIVSMGSMAAVCMSVSDELRLEGLQTEVLSCPTVEPMDRKWLLDRDPTIPILTVEEHILRGGFGSAVLEAANEVAPTSRITRLGLRKPWISAVGGQDFLREQNGLGRADILAATLSAIR